MSVTVTAVDDRSHPGRSDLKRFERWSTVRGVFSSSGKFLGPESDVGPEDGRKGVVPGVADKGETREVAVGKVV